MHPQRAHGPEPSRLTYLLFISLLSVMSFASLSGVSKPAFAQSAQSGYVRSTTRAGVPLRWHTSCVPLYLNMGGRTSLDQRDVEGVLQRSLQAWSDPSCALLSLVYEGETLQDEVGYLPMLGDTNKNTITFRSSNVGERWPYDPSALALTTVTFCESDSPECAAGTVIDADIEINGVQYSFSTGRGEGVIDLENTLTHELGHLLGFDHSPLPYSTMFASTVPGDLEKRDLASEDIEGLCDVYPLTSCLTCNLNSYDFDAARETALAGEVLCRDSGEGSEASEDSEVNAEQTMPPVNCAQLNRGFSGRSAPPTLVLMLLLALSALIKCSRTRSARSKAPIKAS